MSKIIDLKTRRYDAASQSTRTQSWRAPHTDANAANSSPTLLRARARDLVRNNPWAAKGLSVIVNNTIGYGIRPQFRSEQKRAAKLAQALWKTHAESTAIDASGHTDVYGLQQLAMRAMVQDGEVLIRMRPRLPSDGYAVPMQLQVLEADYLFDGNDGSTTGGGYIHRGIEYNAIGQRVAYWLYKSHPGSSVYFSVNNIGAYSRVPADEIVHLFRLDRPGQERGVTWLAPVMIRLRELDIYEDAYLNRQKLANLFAGFIETDNPEDTEKEYSDTDELISGAMYSLRPGQKPTFSDPPDAGDYGPYTLSNLRAVAAGWEMPYEALTGDLSQVNFSSARMGWQEFGRSIDSWRYQLIIPRLCQWIVTRFLMAASISNVTADHTPPARTLVDPAREVPAIKDAIRAGIMTGPEAIREQGYDPEQHLDEIQAFNQMLDARNIKLDCDPRIEANAKLQKIEANNVNTDANNP